MSFVTSFYCPMWVFPAILSLGETASCSWGSLYAVAPLRFLPVYLACSTFRRFQICLSVVFITLCRWHLFQRFALDCSRIVCCSTKCDGYAVPSPVGFKPSMGVVLRSVLDMPKAFLHKLHQASPKKCSNIRTTLCLSTQPVSSHNPLTGPTIQ